MNIGDKVIYKGQYHTWAAGQEVVIVAVHKGARIITGNQALAIAGGVGPGDLIEFAPMVDGRLSFVTSDGKPADFEPAQTPS